MINLKHRLILLSQSLLPAALVIITELYITGIDPAIRLVKQVVQTSVGATRSEMFMQA